METNNGQEDRKIIYIPPYELIRVGRALNEQGFVFVNYKTFTVEMWEQFEGCKESCAVGSSSSSYIVNQSMSRV